MHKAYKIAFTLKSHGFSVWIVGGAVRDFLLGEPFNDIDLTTNATPDKIITIFSNESVDLVGKSFGVVIVNGVEVATYRTDYYPNKIWGSKNCKVKYAARVKEDLSRRDLTINAMAMDPLTHKIYDPFNGRKDLKNKVIRFVGSTRDRIVEDPNRILRACRFCAKIGGKFSSITLSDLKFYNHYLVDVAKERIAIEIMKAMKIRKASPFFTNLREINCLKYIFPSLERSWEFDGGDHHRENVGEHNMMCGDAISEKFPLLKLAGYLHDCSKDKAYHTNKGKNYVGHDQISADDAFSELMENKFPKRDSEYIFNMIKYHMSNPFGIKNVKRFINKVGFEGYNFRDSIRLRIADRKANLKCNPYNYSEIRKVAELFTESIKNKEVFGLKDLKIDGDDVLNALKFNLPDKEANKIKPGPIVGKFLKEILDLVLDEKLPNIFESQFDHIVNNR